MALPALRQPKNMTESSNLARKSITNDPNYMILTLRNEVKLVITSDAYNGIITEGNMYKCVFCGTTMDLQCSLKESHKNLPLHKARMVEIPYVDIMAENLIRKLNQNVSYCMLCKVSFPIHCINRHTATNVHLEELDKAVSRALTYTPT